jgi:putative tryptophan/tyrosine transport system substrate-binding protein
MNRRAFITLGTPPLPSSRERVGVRGFEAHRETFTRHPTPLPMGEGAERARGASTGIKRREVMTLLGGAAAAPWLLWPLAARAQQPQKVPRIGVLLPGTATSFARRTKAFLEGLRELGYIDGQTIAIEWKWGQDRVEGLSELAAELVGRNVNVLVTGGTQAAKALKSATETIPIVMAIIGDPVAAGLVESLARPGGNATGFSIVAPDLSGKRLELLKEIVPDVSPVAVMLNPGNPQSQFELKEMQAAARALGLQLHGVQVSPQDSLDEAFAAMTRASARGLIVLTDPIFFSQRRKIVELASRSRLPAMYFFQEFVAEGGLVSYAPSDTDLYRRSAGYVHRILNGAKPSELPVEQPTKFDLVINLKTAKALGLEVPPTLVARADEVIE